MRGQEVGRRVGDAQEVRRGDLGGADLGLVGELDRRALESAATEFFAEGQSKYAVGSRQARVGRSASGRQIPRPLPNIGSAAIAISSGKCPDPHATNTSTPRAHWLPS